MGRTIHFTLKSTKPFTKKEIQTLIQISEKYNSGDYENVWTCENFYISPFFNKSKTSIYSFCKVQGNEFNSYLVIQALKEISLLLPHIKIYVNDEGEYLKISNIIIQNGYAYIDKKEQANLYDYLKFTNDDKYICEFYQKRDDFIEFLQLEKRYSFNEVDLLKGEYGVLVEDMCREISIDDFADYQSSEATIMGGFDGEYWNKDVDAEKQSYEMLAFITKLFNPDGENKIEILKQI